MYTQAQVLWSTLSEPVHHTTRSVHQPAHIILLSILVALTTVAAGEGHTVGVNVQLTHFTAECGYLQALAADHTELALVETKGTKAVGYRHPDEAWCNACARGLHLLQALLMGHEVADIAQEASQSPDEVRAEVAEGRLGECHLAKAVARCCGANSSASPLRP